MPTLMAGLVGSVLAWLVGDTLAPYLGLPLSALLSLAAGSAVFFPVRNWLRDLRGQ